MGGRMSEERTSLGGLAQKVSEQLEERGCTRPMFLVMAVVDTEGNVYHGSIATGTTLPSAFQQLKLLHLIQPALMEQLGKELDLAREKEFHSTH